MQTRKLYSSGGYFRAVGSLPAARRHLKGAVLGDGRILIGGGSPDDTSQDTYADDLYKYDPITQTFIASGTMSTDRKWHASFGVATGNVIFCGGNVQTGISAVATAEEYDFRTDTLTAVGDMLNGLQKHAAHMTADGRGYVTLGANSAGTAVTGAQRYSFKTKAFSARNSWGSYGFPTSFASINNGNLVVKVSDTIYEHDVTSDSTVSRGTIGLPRNSYAAVSLASGAVLYTAGYSSGYTSDAQIYYPEFNIGLTVDSYPISVAYIEGVSSFSGNVICGGANLTSVYDLAMSYEEVKLDSFKPEFVISGGTSATGTVTSGAEKFNSAAGTFRSIGPSTTGRTQSAGAFLDNLGTNQALIMGGVTQATTFLNTAEKLDPSSEVWSATAGNMNSVRKEAVGMSVNNPTNQTRIAVIYGGRVDNTANNLSTGEYYNPVAGVFNSITGQLPAGRHRAGFAEIYTGGQVDGILMGGFSSIGAFREEIYHFNCVSQTWVTKSTQAPNPVLTPPIADNACANVAGGDTVVSIGGHAVLGSALSTIKKYVFSTNTISSMLAITSPARIGASASALTDGKVIIMGGYNGSTSFYDSVNILDVASDTLRTLPAAMNSPRLWAAITARMHPFSMPVEAAPPAHYEAMRTEEDFNSGVASLKLREKRAQSFDIQVRQGDAVDVVLYAKKSASYTDSGTAATAPKIKLTGVGIGPGVNESITATTISDSAWTQYNVFGTALTDGVVKITIQNDSAQPEAFVFIDDIVLL